MSTEMTKTSTKQHNRTAFDNQAAAAKAARVEFDPADIERFLLAQPDIHGVSGIRDLATPGGAGASNGILFFTADLDDGSRTTTSELVLRYETDTPLIKQKRFEDEYQTILAVNRAGLPAPVARWHDCAGRILGRPSYVTDRVHGLCPPSSIYAEGILQSAEPATRRAMMLAVAEFHGKLHAANIGPDRVPHLTTRGVGPTAIERELSWWFTEATLASPSDDKLDFLRRAHDRLIAVQPDPYPARLVHGDAQFANCMFGGTEIAAVLDWELSFLGHGESDLALVTLFADALNPADDPVDGVPTEQEFIAAYEAQAGRPVAAWEFFQAFNLVKVATAMVFGAGTMPGADSLFAHYSALLTDAIDRIPS
ncbi:phosphotransferase family protein [Mycolicibacterium sp. 22603]|uniref:phosphotransferase family protein n=1 Tax=Mycolicibacterium sp. 22603 TaxID=3453950 RepID=UPI003F856137